MQQQTSLYPNFRSFFNSAHVRSDTHTTCMCAAIRTLHSIPARRKGGRRATRFYTTPTTRCACKHLALIATSIHQRRQCSKQLSAPISSFAASPLLRLSPFNSYSPSNLHTSLQYTATQTSRQLHALPTEPETFIVYTQNVHYHAHHTIHNKFPSYTTLNFKSVK